MDFFVPCPPTGDSILDSEEIRQQLLDQLMRSRPNADGTGKKEYGGYVYQRDDGTYFLQPSGDLTATDCGYTLPAGSPPPISGATALNKAWHTHPSYHGERLYGCRNAAPNDIVTADRDPKWGGGSERDWETADTGGPVYIIDLDKNVYRLDPGTDPSQWGNNPNRWKFYQSSPCLIHT